MSRRILLTAGAEEEDLRVDRYLADALDGLSRSYIQRILKDGGVTVNGNEAKASLRLQENDRIELSGIVLDKSAHQVTIDGEPVELSFKEFELLEYFMENNKIALSREKILNHVWNYDYFGDARTIDTHVKKLRSKLGAKGELIKTIWGMGYKLEA